MKTLHILSHTHWDREWYLTFQQFRMKLVDLVDGLLALLSADSHFRFFMLDGQTIVLEDYLQIRPEAEDQIRTYVRKGRILVGPWHILPDMFLVSPEAHIRNLLQGERTARRFGPKMEIGYIPDPFGHPGQVPQILRGFGIETACIWRGLDDQPAEFWWESPDGSRVLMVYMRDSYSNGASLATSQPAIFTEQLAAAQASLESASTTRDHLIMLGTDHMAPSPQTAAAIAYADRHMTDTRVVHSSLPRFVKALRKGLKDVQIPVVTGELRACKRSPLLPGVLSTRMWIKQRNRACETLLEKWAEPFSTFATLLAAGEISRKGPEALPVHFEPAPLVRQPEALVRRAWWLLMENHPHDSICGCSIDQVHEEMRPRFDQVDQIGEEITRQSLQTISRAVDTTRESAAAAILVFNPGSEACTGPVVVEINLSDGIETFEVIDDSGQVLPYQRVGAEGFEVINMILDRQGLQDGFAMVHDGLIAGMAVQQLSMAVHQDRGEIRMLLSENGPPNLKAWESGLEQGRALLEDPGLTSFHVLAHMMPASQVSFVAPEVPAHGWKTFWVQPLPMPETPPARVNPLVRPLLPLAMRLFQTRLGGALIERLTTKPETKPPFKIENEFFTVEASPVDGTLTLRDKRTGTVFAGLNRFVDGGEAGDEYNYAPPAADTLVAGKLVSVKVTHQPVVSLMEISTRLEVPVSLAPDRQSRSSGVISLPVLSKVRLYPGVPRLEIETEVDNRVRDHRLRVHFPAPFPVSHADHDGHFEVVRRPVGAIEPISGWAEAPRPEVPQRTFTDISNGEIGLMVANRGLPEVEVLLTPTGNAEVALTLLRCVDWLSRDDLSTRDGHAGPAKYTPGAQMPGKWTFHYAVIPHTGGWATACDQAAAFETPLRAVDEGIHPGVLPPASSFLAHSPDSFAISAIKRTEDGRGWLVRGTNLSSEPVEVSLTPWRRFSHAERTDLAENQHATLSPAADGAVTFPVTPHQIASVVFRD